MAARFAQQPTSAGVVGTLITGATIGDTVPAGSTLVVQNAGASSHTFTLTTAVVYDGDLAISDRTHIIAAGAWRLIYVPYGYGDANGQVAVVIDGAATEVKYLVLAVAS
jgi:hypothetical protein